VVRIDRDDEGSVTGVIERVRTGQKEPFSSLEAIAGLIARMVEAETGPPAHSPRRPIVEVNCSSKRRKP